MPNDRPVPTAGGAPGDQDLRDLVESADVGMHFSDADGFIIWANEADYRHLGYTRDEYIGHHVSEFHADADVIRDMLATLRAGGRLTQAGARLLCKDGSVRYVEITTSARFEEVDGQQEFVHTRCFTQDVTERRSLEEARDLLVRAGQTLSRSLDVDQTLDVLSKLIVPQFADWYAVHLRNDDDEVVPAHISHVDPALRQFAWAALGQWPEPLDGPSAPAATIRSGRPLLEPRVTREALTRFARSDEHMEMLTRADITSAIVVPLKVQQDTIGAMTFLAAESRRSYDADDLALAEALASRAALAIANARLHQQATEARETAERAAQRLAILLRASECIALSLQPDEALTELARFATPLLADYCVTYRLDADESVHLIGQSHADASSEHLLEALERAGPVFLEDEQGIGAVLRSGEPSLTPEVSPALMANARNAEQAAALRELQPRSSIIVPLKARGRTLGGAAFVCTDLSGRRYTASDLALAEELAARVALLVDNARLYEAGQEANRAMEDMLSIVAHDLRNPLNTVVTSTAVLDLNVSDEQRHMSSAAIRRATTQMARLLDDLADITRIGQRRLSIRPERTELRGLVEEALTMHEPIARSRELRLHFEAGCDRVAAQADPARLTQALSNLMDNALKFTPAGGEVRVRLDVEEGCPRISVTDSGPGVAHEQIPRLFDRFWRSEGNTRDGLGLGLSIAKGIMDAHGGRIEVRSRSGEGSTFTMVLRRWEQG